MDAGYTIQPAERRSKRNIPAGILISFKMKFKADDGAECAGFHGGGERAIHRAMFRGRGGEKHQAQDI